MKPESETPFKDLAESVPMEKRMAYNGPWWHLLNAEDQAKLAEVCKRLFK